MPITLHRIVQPALDRTLRLLLEPEHDDYHLLRTKLPVGFLRGT